MLSLIALSLAAEPSVGLSLAGEAALGKALNDRFRATSLGGQLQASVPVLGAIEGRVTFGYRNLSGTRLPDEYLWYAPIDLTVALSLPVGKGAFFVHAGPSLVVWGSTPSEGDTETGNAGGNWGAVAELGVRIPTRLYQAPLYDTSPLLQGIDVVVSGGGRWSDVHDDAFAAGHGCGDDCGLDFSAIRLNAGLAARF